MTGTDLFVLWALVAGCIFYAFWKLMPYGISGPIEVPEYLAKAIACSLGWPLAVIGVLILGIIYYFVLTPINLWRISHGKQAIDISEIL